MSKRARIRLTLSFVACLCISALALMEFPSRSHAFQRSAENWRVKGKTLNFVPGEVLVRYRTESMAQSKTGRGVMATKRGLMLADVQTLDQTGLVKGLRLMRVAPEETFDAIEALKAQPEVLYAEPNYILHADAVPNDQHLAQQYALGKIAAQQAWDITTGNSSVVVAVVDQGIDTTHGDLQPNIWVNPAPGSVPGITGDVNGYNFNADTGTVFSNADAETHATHVAGIIGAVGNNAQGIAGVNWSVRLMSLKFLDTAGSGDTADAVRACAYAAEMRRLWNQSGGTQGANVRVINASFGGTEFSTPLLDALAVLNTREILFVAAAGNKDFGTMEPDNDRVPHFPANYDVPNVVSVASTDANDNLSEPFPLLGVGGTHFGATTVDLGAPGEDILSTTPPCSNPGGDDCAPDLPSNPGPTQDTYSFFHGTSMAAPHVSGAAALLWANNPNLTLQDVKKLLLLNGDVQPALVNKTLTGRRLNVFKSLQSAQEADGVAPGAVTNFQALSQTGRTLNLSWNAAGDDGAGGSAAALYEISFIDGATGAVFPLKGVVPATPGAAQNTQIAIPIRHTSGTLRLRPFDNKGNEGTAATIPVNVAFLSGDPYTISTGSAVALSTGGTRMPLEGDDRYVETAFPTGFVFPFFGENFTEATFSTNGNIFFSDPPRRKALPPGNLEEADDPPGSPRALGGYQMIAGLWEDLDLSTTSRADAGVYFGAPGPGGVLQTPNSSSTTLIFRWQGVPCNFDGFECTGGNPINFEIEINESGVIKTRYGSGNTSLLPTVGIGGGGQDGYFVPSHTKEELPKINLTNAPEVTFSPLGAFSTVVLDAPQVELKSWIFEGRTSVYVKLTFPNAGFSIPDWGTPARSGNDFAVNATIRRSNSLSAHAISNTAQIYDLGVLAPGNYTFAFRNSGTTVKTLNFTVSATAPPPNPIDTAREFVRWQYKDFLRREPDGPGWDHWTGEITMCSDPANRFPSETEPQCVERKRANTSAAFFLSPEFQNTGYFVLRVYRGSLGRMPHFGGSGTVLDEFTRDAATVGAGIVVNDKLEPNVINANKQAFVNQFVTRLEFRTIYDSLNNTQYVDRLFQTTGVTPTPAERQALIDGLTNSTETRASVLFKVVDGTQTITDGHLVFQTNYGKAFYDNLFNAAFVQMEYFGYLLRDPDEGGFTFWLGKLNQFGNWVDAQMVLAFIKSPEYRSRFGAP